MCCDGLLCESEREEGIEHSAFDAAEVPDADDLHPAATARRRVDLPGASGFEDVGVDDDPFDHTGLRAVVAQAFPDVTDWPRIALGDLREGLALFMDLEVLEVNIWPEVGPAPGGVASGYSRSRISPVTCSPACRVCMATQSGWANFS